MILLITRIDVFLLSPSAGVDSATSQYACIWCKCSKGDRHDPDKRWSISDKELGARTIEENVSTSSLAKSKRQFNVSNKPLFPSIPLTNVVIDNLHLFLRVSDVLIRLLITELRRQHAIDKVNKFSTFDVQKYEHLQRFENFVRSLGIPNFQFYIGQNSKMLKTRTLTGTEKLKVFKHIEMARLLPKMDRMEVARIQHLWTELLEINHLLSKSPDNVSTADVRTFEDKAREWVRRFVDVYHRDNVTPYIHAMANHVSEFMQIHGSVLPFTQQGLEKYNDVMTKQYFRATCHRDTQALRQILEKQNRIEYLRDRDAKKPKCFETKCSNCHQPGHKRLTCLEPCSQCSYTPYRAHLIDVDGFHLPACNQEN